jgi:hypothetical protein
MALSKEAQTRVDELRDLIEQLKARHAARVGVPLTDPLFTKHADGSVYDRKGNELRGPLPTPPAKGQ